MWETALNAYASFSTPNIACLYRLKYDHALRHKALQTDHGENGRESASLGRVSFRARSLLHDVRTVGSWGGSRNWSYAFLHFHRSYDRRDGEAEMRSEYIIHRRCRRPIDAGPRHGGRVAKSVVRRERLLLPRYDSLQ